MLRTTLLLGLALLIPACHGTSFPEIRERRVDQAVPGSVGGVDFARTATNGSNTYAVWIDQRNGTGFFGGGAVFFNRSTNGGVTWQPADLRIDRAKGTAGFALLPDIICSGNSLFVVWQDRRNGDFDIYFTRSTDGGVTWLAQDIRLDTDGAGSGASENPQICVSGSTVHVAWQDGRSGETDIRFNRSLNGGATWMSNDVRLDRGTAGAAPSILPRIAAVGSGVAVVWMDLRDGTWDIYFNRSTNRGSDWLQNDVRLDHGTQTAGTPQISWVGNVINVVWNDDRDVKSDVYSNRSTNNGATWLSEDVRLDTDGPGAADSYGHCLVAAGSNVYVAWYDLRDGSSGIYFNRSTDGGSSWLPSDVRLDTPAGPGGGFEPKIAVSGSNVVVMWTDSRNGDSDVYVNRSADGGATWLASDVRIDHSGLGYAFSATLTLSGSTVTVAWVDGRNAVGGSFPNTSVFCETSIDGGATWRPEDTTVSQPFPGGTNGSSSSPALAAHGRSVYVVWHDYRSGTPALYFNRSTDMGKTWQPADLRIGANGIADVSQAQIACNATQVFVVWVDGRDGRSDLYFARSDDGGASFFAEVRLDLNAPLDSFSGTPQIAVAGDDVVVVWTNARFGTSSLYANRSPDGGQTWLPSEVRADATPDGFIINDAKMCRSGDNVYVAWYGNRNGNNDIFFNRSTDGGATWQPEDRLMNTGIPGNRFLIEPTIACSGDTVAVAWVDVTGAQIRSNRSLNAGVHWLFDDVRVDSGANGGSHLQLACSGTSVFATWGESRDGNNQIRFNRSLNGGETWLTDVRIDNNPTTQPTIFPRMVLLGPVIVVAWIDLRNAHPSGNAGESDIYANASLNGGATWGSGNARLDVGNTAHKECDGLRLAAGDLPVATWFDFRSGTADIYVATLKD